MLDYITSNPLKALAAGAIIIGGGVVVWRNLRARSTAPDETNQDGEISILQASSRQPDFLLVAPHPQWKPYWDVLESYRLGESVHAEDPIRLSVAMAEGILPIAIKHSEQGGDVLFPLIPDEFYQFGQGVKEQLLGTDESNVVGTEKAAISDHANPIQLGLALAHGELFAADAVAVLQGADQLQEFATKSVTLERFLDLVETQVVGPPQAGGSSNPFAKASWLASETVMSMAIEVTGNPPRCYRKSTQHTRLRSKQQQVTKTDIDQNPASVIAQEHLEETRRDSDTDPRFGIVVVRPAGHHSGNDVANFAVAAFCGLNHVMTAAAYLAYEGKRVLVIDWDAHFARGSQQIVLEANKKLARLGKPSILLSDISSDLFQQQAAKAAVDAGHLVFTTKPAGNEEMEKENFVNWFPPADQQKDLGKVNDAWLVYSMLATLKYACHRFDFNEKDQTSSTSNREGPDVILVSNGLDAAKGEPRWHLSNPRHCPQPQLVHNQNLVYLLSLNNPDRNLPSVSVRHNTNCECESVRARMPPSSPH